MECRYNNCTYKTQEENYVKSTLYYSNTESIRNFIYIKNGKEIPFSLKGETIFYAGPAPTPPGFVIGPIGPTTSGRMDPYTPFLLDIGLKGMIGKGRRSQEVLDSIVKNKAVYFGATGGTAVLISNSVVSVEKVAYDDLGPEAILRLEVKEMPLVVLADSQGECLYK